MAAQQEDDHLVLDHSSQDPGICSNMLSLRLLAGVLLQLCRAKGNVAIHAAAAACSALTGRQSLPQAGCTGQYGDRVALLLGVQLNLSSWCSTMPFAWLHTAVHGILRRSLSAVCQGLVIFAIAVELVGEWYILQMKRKQKHQPSAQEE